MDHSESGRTNPLQGDSKERTLQVIFEVELSGDCPCPLSNARSRVENVQTQMNGGVCYAEVTVASEDCDTSQVLHTTNQVGSSCLCLAFSNVGCVPRIQRADDDVILIETYVSDRAVISELVEQLKSAAERVSLRRLTSRREEATESNPITVDLSHLTVKQREAATMAVGRGYYQSPRQTSLEELAMDLDISKSALSQRLSAVESKLATAVFDP